ncbi:MAG TPA: hypothetical protein VK456_05230, partial [Xanthobacteraceae bacterium]|nr:hypothetical protein [Xanthobacteraceae bacterium]
IAEIMFGDEHAAIPVGGYHRALGVTLSLPSLVGRAGVIWCWNRSFRPRNAPARRKSAQILRAALERVCR